MSSRGSASEDTNDWARPRHLDCCSAAAAVFESNFASFTSSRARKSLAFASLYIFLVFGLSHLDFLCTSLSAPTFASTYCFCSHHFSAPSSSQAQPSCYNGLCYVTNFKTSFVPFSRGYNFMGFTTWTSPTVMTVPRAFLIGSPSLLYRRGVLGCLSCLAFKAVFLLVFFFFLFPVPHSSRQSTCVSSTPAIEAVSRAIRLGEHPRVHLSGRRNMVAQSFIPIGRGN